ncbi:MAG: hypothetical protein DA408_07510 [Bacteroidetes bacterium]|nr:MAG: hypothetical protein C7N36_03955 [Bacteroidota bacterium]PTM13231.1 MAG: hypothetical protein DA408_07510 [Bacteroidota bacterium]
MKPSTLIFILLVTLALLLAQCQSPSGQPTGLTAAEKSTFLTKGKKIATETFAELSGRLAAALEQGGVAYAVPFCSQVALPLADSMGRANNVIIRRTSLRVRNPADAPLAWETSLLQQFATADQAGEDLQPLVQKLPDGTVVFAAPIRVQPLCLQCHGRLGETLETTDYAVIHQRYPNDQAIGYALGDLRGMWSIQFKE